MADITPTQSRIATTLIAASTSALSSEEFTVFGGEHAVVFSDAMAGVEEVNVQIKKPDGSWVHVVDGIFPLSASKNASAIWGKGVYRMTKSVTAGAVGVYGFNTTFLKRG